MRKRLPLRRLSSLGPVPVALVLLLVVGWVAGAAGRVSTQRADDRRDADRQDLARAYADALRPWLDSGQAEAADLAARLTPARTPASAGPLIAGFLAGGPAFTREAVLIDAGMKVVAASAGPASFTNRQLQKCGSGDPALRLQLVDTVSAGSAPTPVAVPWDCGRARVAVAGDGGGGNKVVVLAPLDDAAARLRALAVPTLRVLLVEPGSQEPPALSKDGGIVASFAAASHGWGVLIEQDQADWERDDASAARGLDGFLEPLVRQFLGPATLLGVSAVVFVLLVVFDRRRRKAHARAEEAKHAFFATIGHELRTPLTILKGYSDTLTARWDSLNDDAKEMLVSNLAPAAQRLASLVEKLILASNMQAEAYVKPVARPTDISDVMDQVAARFRPLAPLHSFRVVVDPNASEALADADALEQVLAQLVDNAVKYSPSGGPVTLVAERARRGVELSVSDEGVGIPEHLAIFEPLVQGEGVDTRLHDEGGAGVGLYIVRTLVRDMGGSVRAERRQPVGSRFVVTLRATKTKPVSRSVARV